MSSPSRTRRRRELRKASACPDCSAHVRVLSDRPGSPHVRVEHDDTCPWWRARGAQPFSQLRLIRSAE
jgi:hypothetical protein